MLITLASMEWIYRLRGEFMYDLVKKSKTV